MKIEPVGAGLAVGFVGALVSLFILFYLHAIRLTSNDIVVQAFGWVMFACLLMMTCLPLLRLELRSAKRILTPLESKR